MLVILLNNAFWDCFKTPILREISRTQNPLLEEHCAFGKSYFCSTQLDVQETLLFLTVQQNMRSSLWTLVRDCTGFSLSMCFCPGKHTLQIRDNTEQPIVNCDKDHGPNKRCRGMINVLNIVDCVPSNVKFSHQETSFVFEDSET